MASTSPDLAQTPGGLDVSTVSSAPQWPRRFDPLRRREEFADVFAAARVRADVEALARLASRGSLDLGWVAELFVVRAAELVPLVRVLDREGLRCAYALLFLEERLVTDAVGSWLERMSGAASDLRVRDAIGDVIGAATRVDDLARAWAWFVDGDVMEPTE